MATFAVKCSGITVVDLAKDPCLTGSLARSTTENQVATEHEGRALFGLMSEASAVLVCPAIYLRLYIAPGTRFGTGKHRVADLLCLERVTERWAGWIVRSRLRQEIGHRMHERVLVADLQTGHPPIAHVGLIPIADVDITPSTNNRIVVVIEVLQSVQIVQIPRERRLFAIHLESVERLVPTSVTGRLENGGRAVLEFRQKSTGVVDSDWLHFARIGVNALLDECVRHRRDALDWSVEPNRGVDAVSQQVARDPTSGRFDVQSPCARTTLGNVFGNRPVLKELRSVVKNSA